MSGLGAFFRGAAGQGLLDMSQRMGRDQELEAARMQREQEKEEERKWREEQARLDREARAELAGARGTGGSRGALSAAADPAGADNSAMIYGIMREFQVSRPEAEAMLKMGETGENGFTREEQVPEQIDDGDRMRTVTTRQVKPDVEKFKKLMATIGGIGTDAPSMARSNIDQVEKSRTERWQRESGQKAQADEKQAGALAVGPAVAAGKPIYNEGDNLYTGATGAKTQAETKAAGALAAERSAGAAKHNADVGKIKAEMSGDLKKQTPEKLTTTLNAINGLIRTYDENSMDDTAKAARAELQTMARQIANELSTRGLGSGKAEPGPGGGKPAASAAPPAPKNPSSRKPGTVYDTPRGPMKWTGTGWLKV